MRKFWMGGWCLAALALMACAAETETASLSTVFGILKVESDRTSTLVSVPWTGMTGADTNVAISVADIVKTANLTAGDRLLSYNPTRKAYDGWELIKDAAGLLAWEPMTTVSTEGVIAAPVEGEATLGRGQSLWLVRQDVSKPFYLQGQFTAASAQVVVAGGTASVPAYTLLGNPTMTAEMVNDLDWGAKPVAGDKLTIPDGSVPRVLSWDPSTAKWFRTVPMEVNGRIRNVKTTTDKINPGVGFWYVRQSEETFTFTWKKKGN